MGNKREKRPLTEILQRYGEAKLPGSELKAKEQLAENVWSLLTNGKLCFPDHREIKASVKDWKDTAQWLYNHCDGGFRPTDLSGSGLEAKLQSMSAEDLRSRISAVRSKLEQETESPED